jgi:hypothetical protein
MSNNLTHVANTLNNKYLISLLLFLLAFVPRLLDLDRFLTPDEFLWVDRSQDFLAGLTNPDYECVRSFIIEWEGFTQKGLGCTLRTGHPGVTTMWSGTFGFILRWLGDGIPQSLHDYVLSVSTDPLDPRFIAPTRFGVVLVTSLAVVGVYWLARRLFGQSIALIATLLLALAPFHIGLSRVIHHDALSTTFMTLSALCALIYWGEGVGRRWLVASGLLAGFGFLSKSPAMYLMPFVAITGFWFAFTRGQMQADWKKTLRQLILDGLLWFAVAAAIFVVFWPAMWVIPLRVLETVFVIGSKYASGGHAKGNFFLGEISHDPGPLFYPITWLYRVSPLVIVGVAAFIVIGLMQWWQKQIPSPAESGTWTAPSFKRYLPLILILVAGYYLLMTSGAKKQERYFLPIYPWLNFLAATGLVALVNIRPIAQRITLHTSRIAMLILTVLIVNGLLVISNFPYYFTYYSPLFGGIKNVAKISTIGWGEGLDEAARYLNQNVGQNNNISSWYQSTFAPFYNGPSLNYSKEKGKVLAGDYVVFYINQVQREYPDTILFEYFEQRFELETAIELHGLDYAWIYPSLSVDHYVEDQVYTGIASLLAWQWAAGDDAALLPGQSADFELYWEYLGKQPDEAFFFRLVDKQGLVWAEGLSQPVAMQNPAVDRWREGEIIFEQGTLPVPVDMPPGQYRLQIGFYTKAPAVTQGELLFKIPDEEALVTVSRMNNVDFVLPAEVVPVDQPLGGALTLLGATWPTEPATPGDNIRLDLYWRVEQPLPADTKFHIGLMDGAGGVQQAWFDLTMSEIFNAVETTWQPGDIIHTYRRLDLQPDVAPNTYYFEVVLRDDVEQTLPFGALVVE